MRPDDELAVGLGFTPHKEDGGPGAPTRYKGHGLTVWQCQSGWARARDDQRLGPITYHRDLGDALHGVNHHESRVYVKLEGGGYWESTKTTHST